MAFAKWNHPGDDDDDDEDVVFRFGHKGTSERCAWGNVVVLVAISLLVMHYSPGGITGSIVRTWHAFCTEVREIISCFIEAYSDLPII